MNQLLKIPIVLCIYLLCFESVSQCNNIALADSSFEEGTLADGSNFQPGQWYANDGCELSGMNSFHGDSVACSISGGAFQFVAVDSNTTYYLSCYVLNGNTDPWIAFTINWLNYPISVNSDNWEQTSIELNSGSDTALIVGFYSASACVDAFRLTCEEVVSIEDENKIEKPYLIGASVTSNSFNFESTIPCYVEVVDMTGKLFERYNSLTGKISFGQDLPPSMYILRISSGNQFWTEKIIKY